MRELSLDEINPAMQLDNMLIQLRLTPLELQKQISLTFQDDQDDLGSLKVAFVAQGQSFFALEYRPEAPSSAEFPNGVIFRGNYNNLQDLKNLLPALNISVQQISWVSPLLLVNLLDLI